MSLWHRVVANMPSSFDHNHHQGAAGHQVLNIILTRAEIEQLAIDAADALYQVHGTVFDPINSADLCEP